MRTNTFFRNSQNEAAELTIPFWEEYIHELVSEGKEKLAKQVPKALWYKGFDLYSSYSGLNQTDGEWEMTYSEYDPVRSVAIHTYFGVKNLCVGRTTFEELYATEDEKTIVYYSSERVLRWIDQPFWCYIDPTNTNTFRFWELSTPEYYKIQEPSQQPIIPSSHGIPLTQKPTKETHIGLSQPPKPTILHHKNHQTSPSLAKTYTGKRTITVDDSYAASRCDHLEELQQVVGYNANPYATCLEQNTTYTVSEDGNIWISSKFEGTTVLAQLCETSPDKAALNSSQTIYMPVNKIGYVKTNINGKVSVVLNDVTGVI